MNVAALAFDEVSLLEAVDQFDRAVVPNAQPVCEIGNRRLHSLGQTFQGEQELILSRSKACSLGGLLAECQVAGDLVTKLRQSAVISKRHVSLGWHFSSIRRL